MPKTINLAINLETNETLAELIHAVHGNEIVASDDYIIIPRATLHKAAHDLHNRLMPIEGADLEYPHVEQGLWDWFVNFVDATVLAASTRSLKNGEQPALISHIATARMLSEIRAETHEHEG